ncbi:MAG TPA: response regulator transcription factor [Baekduia sp.]|uniref:response regulator n=1 Tax=Baekduia sp. TaxID=2600305 RepID=UPI002BB7C025|nr:response regulator transcription factor [Baekduia sp.]HMJ36858.1 response regulator transcription factor [Baekduia sp.]
MSGETSTRDPVRVLLADDASEMRALLRWALLRDEGVTVVGEASDGTEAVALVAQHLPDVVVLDLQMPGLPPGELLVAMAQAAPGTPIVTFSGFEPELVAPVQARLVTLHIPKTTDLALVRESIVGVARGADGT